MNGTSESWVGKISMGQCINASFFLKEEIELRYEKEYHLHEIGELILDREQEGGW